MHRRLTALATAACIGLAALLGAPPAAAEPPGISQPELGFYSVPYSSTLWWVRKVAGGTSLGPATFAEWGSQGYPTPRPVPSLYQRAPWSSTIIGVPQFPGWRFSTETVALTYEGWGAVGYPSPEVTWRPVGTIFRKYVNSPVIYAVLRATMEEHALTYPEWVASGTPSPMVFGTAPGTTFYQWPTSAEIFMELDGAVQKLSYPQWASYGYPTPVRQAGGFYKLTWDPSIAYIEDDGGSVLTWDDWVAEAFPTPVQVPVLPGDTYCYDAALNVVSYLGLTVDTDLDPAVAVQRLGVPLESIPACAAG